MFVNVFELYGGKMCTQLWGNQQSVHFRCLINVSNFQYPKLGLLNGDGNC